MQDVCPQCNKTVKGPSCRLVQDSCGHKKCRQCLLNDEEKCFLCTQKITHESVIRYEDNHTAVITFKGKDSDPVTCNENPATIKPTNLSKEVQKGVCHESVSTNTGAELQKRNYQSLPVPNYITISTDYPPFYTCNICKKQFKTRSHIKYHKYCLGGAKPLKCGRCQKEFVKKSHLEMHVANHTGRKPYVCDKCGKSFAQKGKLKRHVLLHLEVKPFVCQKCGKCFRTKDTLKIHCFIHTGEKPFACKHCKAKFNNSSNLKKHLVIHSNEEAHMCDQCGKRFKLKSSLIVHRRIHSHLRPHTCAVCSKTFVNLKDLQRHALIHMDEKAYTCGICGTRFRRKDNLDRHMRNTHPGKKPSYTKKNVQDSLKPALQPLIDNPNAIKVITASPAHSARKDQGLNEKSRPVPVINAPLKLAFKTSTFKNSYNIQRNYIEPTDNQVSVYEKILLPNGLTEKLEKDKSLSDSRPKTFTTLNYETSFEHKTHAIIKNIKFKLPSEYINKDRLTEVASTQEEKNVEEGEEEEEELTYTELKPLNDPVTATASVIVNAPLCQSGDLHWRKRQTFNFYQNNDDL